MFRLVVIFLVLSIAGCKSDNEHWLQGYIEGDFTRVASAAPGRLQLLAVTEGDWIKVDQLLFKVEAEREIAAHQRALNILEKSGYLFEDSKKGKRAEEIRVLEAQLNQATAEHKLAETRLARYNILYKKSYATKDLIDQTQAEVDIAQAKINEIQQQLKVAKLPARDDEVKAARAEVGGAKALTEETAWDLSQRQVLSPITGRVQDIYYQTGEWVSAGAPVISILAPNDIKIIFYVPETLLSSLTLGKLVTSYCDNCSDPVSATVSFISTEAEYTPPVIYNRQNRYKLVYRVEAEPKLNNKYQLHPGQPMDVLITHG